MREVFGTLRSFWQNERSGMHIAAVTAIPVALAGIAAGLHFLLRPDEHYWRLSNLSLGAVALPVVAGSVKDGDNHLRMERNFARDIFVFKTPTRKDTQKGLLTKQILSYARNHRSEQIENAVQWKWQHDVQNRAFMLPRELVDYLPSLHFVRDLLAAASTLFLNGRREGNKVVTSMRELCRVLDISPNQENFDRIEAALAMLRMYTIQAQRVPLGVDKKGEIEWGNKVFGFIASAGRVTHVGDDPESAKPLPPSKQRVEITFTDEYARMLELRFGKNGSKDLLCTIPVAALKAAQKLGINHVVAAKNLVYHLAGRGGRAVMTQEKVLEVAGFHPSRPAKAAKAVSNLLMSMERAGIISVQTNAKGSYVIELKGLARKYAAEAGDEGATVG